MSKFELGDSVIIYDGFYSSNKAIELAKKNGHINWTPTGTIKKLPSKDDKINYDNGDEWEILDNYNVELFINPHKKTQDTLLITYLDKKDLKHI